MNLWTWIASIEALVIIGLSILIIDLVKEPLPAEPLERDSNYLGDL